MDALSLLCTLHADGPATLQRLRGLGCGGLGAFLAMNADDLAEALGLEAAVARRLLREGRILAERLGSEALEAEETAPVATQPAALPEPAPAGPALDEGDAALVARIVSDPPAEADEGEETPAAFDAEPVAEALDEEPADELAEALVGDPTQEIAEEPVEELVPATESFEEEKARALAFLDEEPVDADMAAAGMDGVDGIPDDAPGLAAEELAPGDEALVAAACDVLTVGGLPGLDSAMVEDLAAAGITTLGALGAADSLTLTRNLGVTFAQARRMRFLARRAADNLAAQAAEAEMEQGAGESIETTAGPVQASEEAALPIETSEEALNADAEPAPGTPSQSTASAPTRPPFWEPRPFHSGGTTEEPQGVKVDPTEIEARPRIGDRLPRQAAQSPAAVEPRSGGRTVLGWNFEIPRPAAEELPLPSFGANGAGAPDAPEEAPVEASSEAEAQVGSDEGAGPFA